MIIIDTKASDYKIIDGITNIPLYGFKPLKYKIKNIDFTDFIFQSTQAVLQFSKHINLLKKKNINVYAMGHTTSKVLKSFGIESISPEKPGSKHLIKMIKENIDNKKFLIVKGSDGLNDIYKFLKESDVLSEEINVYKRIELKDYKALVNKFNNADAIIFPSVYAIEIFFREIYTKNTNTKLFCVSDRILQELNKRGQSGFILDNYFSSNDLIKEIKESI